MNWDKVSQKSNEFNESNDCAVKALSIAMDTAYSVIHKLLKLQGRPNRQGTYKHQQQAVIEQLGFKLEPIQVKAKTVTTLERENLQGYNLVYVRGHVLAVVNGSIEDWTQGRKHRILQGYKVVPACSRKERKEKLKNLLK
jgi:hypothetical protein